MTPLLLALGALVASLAGEVHADQEARLYPFRKGPSFGFVDRTGRVAIEPTFDRTPDDPEQCTWFAEGLQPVEVDREWKYIDRTGAVAIEDSFTLAGCFFEGLAVVRKTVTGPDGILRSSYGYIEPSGRFRIEPRFDDARRFSEGLALVMRDTKYGYVDAAGEIVIPLTFESGMSCAEFSEGLACAAGKEGKGFIDRTGAFVIPPVYEYIGPFAQGMAPAGGKAGDRHWGYLAPNGEWAIAPRFQTAWQFSEGLARVKLDGGEMAFIDLAGKIQFTLGGAWWTEPFREGLAKAEFRGVGTGYIDRTGALAIAQRFSDAKSFQGGVASVVENGRPLLIDRSGAIVRGQTQRALPEEPVRGPERIDAELFSEASGYPGPFERKLVASGPAEAAGHFGKTIWGVAFENADGAPGQLAVWLIEGDTFLTDDLKARLEPMVERDAARKRVRRIPQARGADGYSFSWGGPDAGVAQTVLPSPKGAYEVLVMLIVDDSFEAPPGKTSAQEWSAYSITEEVARAVHRALF